jgi:hypothetical protein
MKSTVAIVLFIFLFSCSDTDYAVVEPESLVSRDTLIRILKELSLIESHVQDNYIHVGAFGNLMKKSGEEILRKYNVAPLRFEETMDYYGTHQDEMIAVYEQVLDSLNKEASRLPQDSTFFRSEPRNPMFNGVPTR